MVLIHPLDNQTNWQPLHFLWVHGMMEGDPILLLSLLTSPLQRLPMSIPSLPLLQTFPLHLSHALLAIKTLSLYCCLLPWRGSSRSLQQLFRLSHFRSLQLQPTSGACRHCHHPLPPQTEAKLVTFDPANKSTLYSYPLPSSSVTFPLVPYPSPPHQTLAKPPFLVAHPHFSRMVQLWFMFTLDSPG